MTENEIAEVIVDAAYHIHKTLGPSLLESVYQRVMLYELRKRGLHAKAEVPVYIAYDGQEMGEAFRADIIVEDKVIVELKSVEKTAPVHYKQLLTYLRLADKRLGLLINFGEAFFKRGIKRIANNMPE